MKRTHALPPAAVLLALIAASASASGGAPGSATPAISGLPQGTLVSPAVDKPPASIAANEKVDGFTVALPPKTLSHGLASYVTVAANEAMANPFSGSGNAEPDATCFTQTMSMGSSAPPEWMPQGQTRLILMIPTAESLKSEGPMHESPVHAIRSEKLVATGGKTTLEVAYAWVDARTRGARLITRETVPLAQIATGPSGVAVYAAHDPKSLEVVVKPGDPMSSAGRRLSLVGHGLSGVGPDGRFVSSNCGHSRIRLSLEPHAADMATFTGDVELAPVQDAALAQGTGQASSLGSTELRQRPLRVSVSASWLSRDKEPVLSVSFGWNGPEKSRVF